MNANGREWGVLEDVLGQKTKILKIMNCSYILNINFYFPQIKQCGIIGVNRCSSVV